jgi:hypothetical protein
MVSVLVQVPAVVSASPRRSGDGSAGAIASVWRRIAVIARQDPASTLGPLAPVCCAPAL